MGLFQQGLQPVLELDPVARQLDLRAGYRPPPALLGRRHEAQDQLLGDHAPHQPFGVGEVALPPPRRAIGLGLGEVQGARHRAGPGPGPGARRPVPFQGGPDGPPVLRRRFHDDVVDLAFAEPGGQQAQLGGRAPERAPLERVLRVGGEIGDDHGQHPFVQVNAGVHVNAGDRVGQGGGSFRRERRACLAVALPRVTGYRGSPRRRAGRPRIRSTRTLRIRQRNGLHRSTKRSTLSLLAVAIIAQCDFHEVSRAEGPP